MLQKDSTKEHLSSNTKVLATTLSNSWLLESPGIMHWLYTNHIIHSNLEKPITVNSHTELILRIPLVSQMVFAIRIDLKWLAHFQFNIEHSLLYPNHYHLSVVILGQGFKNTDRETSRELLCIMVGRKSHKKQECPLYLLKLEWVKCNLQAAWSSQVLFYSMIRKTQTT